MLTKVGQRTLEKPPIPEKDRRNSVPLPALPVSGPEFGRICLTITVVLTISVVPIRLSYGYQVEVGGQPTRILRSDAAMERTLNWKNLLGASAILVATTLSAGCQVDVAGQTLPSPYYEYDDIQIYPHGPEFKLQNEADAMKAYKAEGQLGEE